MYRFFLSCLAVILFSNCLNLFLAFRVLPQARYTQSSANRLAETYTFIADDFPEFWDIGEMPMIGFPVQETEHYPVTGEDATRQWASYTPAGSGYLRLGPENRDFALAMTHEDHCLRLIRGVLANPSLPIARAMPYCLNYLRQMILCMPNLTLESPDDLLDSLNFTTARHGSVHVCKDWRKVYAALDANWDV
ncbi:hypothetical protein B0H19DRAFT_695071 [Mycena capillaripes]|nr:hypothetical protein B0H19DRAFT_695071 [Mycena capillaripes]